jgi:hypothetical protein
MKLQYVLTHWHKFYRTQEILDSRPTVKYVMFLHKCKDKQFFCGHNILTEGVFVT